MVVVDKSDHLIVRRVLQTNFQAGRLAACAVYECVDAAVVGNQTLFERVVNHNHRNTYADKSAEECHRIENDKRCEQRASNVANKVEPDAEQHLFDYGCSGKFPYIGQCAMANDDVVGLHRKDCHHRGDCRYNDDKHTSLKREEVTWQNHIDAYQYDCRYEY